MVRGILLPGSFDHSLAYRPLHLLELRILAGLEEMTGMDDLQKLVHLCGSFLTIREDYAYLIHSQRKTTLPPAH
jgi:hypothetical protein